MGEVEVLEPFGTVAILGVGLIGGSVGLALRSRGLSAEVIGVGRDAATLDLAVKRGAIDRATTDVREGVGSAEVVVVCTPVDRVVEDVRRCAEAAASEVLITDAGSSKRQIVEALERHRGARRSSSARIRSPVRSGGAWLTPGPTSSMAGRAC